MSSTLDRRLAALEAVARTADYFVLIVIKFIEPGVEANRPAGQRAVRAFLDHDIDG